MNLRMNQILDGIRLDPTDQCYFLGEYQAGATYEKGGTNQFISNLKADLSQKPQRAYYKNQAIGEAINQFAAVINPEAIGETTFIPMPGSKPRGHVAYDDRMVRIVAGLAAKFGPTFDGRPVIVTTQERVAQHQVAGQHRVTVAELSATISLDAGQLSAPLRPNVVLVDDVFTLGTSFKAAQQLLLQRPEVKQVWGLFLARTVWPPQVEGVDLSQFLSSLK
ncbi:hypothetical protein JY439_02775 [Stenotrophomonas maltophilia]|nr:hypothetical protein [Stenotrophomonas maltophilia]